MFCGNGPSPDEHIYISPPTRNHFISCLTQVLIKIAIYNLHGLAVPDHHWIIARESQDVKLQLHGVHRSSIHHCSWPSISAGTRGATCWSLCGTPPPTRWPGRPSRTWQCAIRNATFPKKVWNECLLTSDHERERDCGYLSRRLGRRTARQDWRFSRPGIIQVLSPISGKVG